MTVKVEVESNIPATMKNTAEEMREGMWEVTEFIAINIQRDAQEAVPFLTGVLHDDIKVQREAFNVSPSGIYGAQGHTVVIDKFYGVFQEFGWTKRSGEFHEPTPWLRPAAWANANRFEGMAKTKVTRVVSKTQKGAAPMKRVTQSQPDWGKVARDA